MPRGLGARSRAASRRAVFSGPSWTRTRSQWIKNPSKASPSVTNRENTGEERCPIATDQTPDAFSKPLRAFSRSTLIASLYQHASALAQAGDIEAARVAHETAGRLLQVPGPTVAVVDLGQRLRPQSPGAPRIPAPKGLALGLSGRLWDAENRFTKRFWAWLLDRPALARRSLVHSHERVEPEEQTPCPRGGRT